ncbi:hypothetical protein [Burkholderia sp. MSMB1498]|uniref:hypothetical protein n=1 Tax=Burkholderia sp. MSMB1498 TaxID=1637842 RepID=UPI0012E3459B|nr:hypothetical protein [Burkholderia sp. MSMB1498]
MASNGFIDRARRLRGGALSPRRTKRAEFDMRRKNFSHKVNGRPQPARAGVDAASHTMPESTSINRIRPVGRAAHAAHAADNAEETGSRFARPAAAGYQQFLSTNMWISCARARQALESTALSAPRQ